MNFDHNIIALKLNQTFDPNLSAIELYAYY